MDTIERVRAVAEPLLQAEGTELVDVELLAGSLRLTVDRPGGVDLAVITRATRQVTSALDHEGSITADYTVEVSSPGLERPLRTPAHFARAVGTDVVVKTVAGTGGAPRRLHGRLVSADDSGITVVEADGAEHQLGHLEIERARTVFEWGPAPKPGHKPKPGQAAGTPGSKARTRDKDHGGVVPDQGPESVGPVGSTVVEPEVGEP